MADVEAGPMDVLWLREQIAADRDRDARVQCRARELYQAWQPNNPYSWDEQASDVHNEYLHAAGLLVDREMPAVLAQCDAHTAILDQWKGLTQAPPEAYGIEAVRVEMGYVVLALALAYQHRSGYRQGWRSTGGS